MHQVEPSQVAEFKRKHHDEMFGLFACSSIVNCVWSDTRENFTHPIQVSCSILLVWYLVFVWYLVLLNLLYTHEACFGPSPHLQHAGVQTRTELTIYRAMHFSR